MGVRFVASERFYSPLKIGIFIVALAYFLFALHDAFTLSWIGEWNRIGGGSFSFEIYFEDIVGFVSALVRFTAGIVAFGAVAYYFAKKNLTKASVFKVLRWVLVLEAIYWVMAFLPTGYFEVRDLFFSRATHQMTLTFLLRTFTLNTVPVLVESIALPIVLFILAYKMSPQKPLKGAISWGMIAGTLYIFLYWLLNTTIWISTMQVKGTAYVTSHPENLLNFILAAFGLLALGFYSAAFTVKSRRAETMQELNLKIVGAVILAFGLYFLWNYLTWVFLGGWSSWYAWFLGHNEDLWILSLPMLGIPLLFLDRPQEKAGPP